MEDKYSIICPLNKRKENAVRLRKAIANDMNNGNNLYKMLIISSKRFLGSHYDCGDIVSQYLLKMSDKKAEHFKFMIYDLNQITKNHRFMRWAYTNVRNLCISHIRSKTYIEKNFTSFEEEDEEGKSYNNLEEALEQELFGSPEQELIKEETARQIKENVLNLGYSHKEVVLMFYFDDLKYKEIADKLNMSIGTVKSNLSRAKKRLEGYILREEEINPLYVK